MKFEINNREIQTNLAGDSFQKLKDGIWEIGLISENVGLGDETNNNYYHSEKIEGGEGTGRCLNNKVNVVLLDGNNVNMHIIHWVPSDDYFCVTKSVFWDQFDN